MKRSVIFILLSFTLILAGFLSLPNYVLFSNNHNNSDTNWILTVNTTITSINSNSVRLNINYTEQYLTSFYFPNRTLGGYFVYINMSNFYWIPYTPSQYTSYHVFQPQGTFSSYYSITFNKSDIFVAPYLGGNDFFMNFNTTGNYSLYFSPNREISAFYAVLHLQTSPNVNLNISPISMQASGLITDSPPISSSSKTNSNSQTGSDNTSTLNNNHTTTKGTQNMSFNVISIIIPIVMCASFINRKRKR